jgi:hypothetical protein
MSNRHLIEANQVYTLPTQTGEKLFLLLHMGIKQPAFLRIFPPPYGSPNKTESCRWDLLGSSPQKHYEKKPKSVYPAGCS